MINFDEVTKENIKDHNPNWPQTSNHPNRILIIGGSGSRKRNILLNLINTNYTLIKFIYMLRIHIK